MSIQNITKNRKLSVWISAIFLFFLQLCMNFSISAQINDHSIGYYPFVYYGIADGIPQEDVLCVFQDQIGYIWIGTYKGAGKYNGRSFQLFTDNEGIAGNSVFDIKQNNKGDIILATDNGISIIQEDTIINILSGIEYRKIFVDREDNIWCYGNNGIVFISINYEVKHFSKQHSGFPKVINNIIQSKNSFRIFFATDDGIFSISSNGKTEKISEFVACYMLIDTDNKYWFGTSNGIYTLKKDLSENPAITDFERFGQINSKIKKLFLGADSSIWTVSEYAIYNIDKESLKVKTFDEKVGLKSLNIYDLIQDREENIWITFAGGIQKLSDISIKIISPFEISGYVHGFYHDEYNRLWFNYNDAVYYLLNKPVCFSDNLLPEESCSVFTQIPNEPENLVCVNSDYIYIIDKKTLKPLKTIKLTEQISYIEFVFVTTKGEIFICTGEDGVIYYLKDLKSALLKIKNEFTSGVYQLIEYQGKIIGTNGTGLVYFNNNTFNSLYNLPQPAWSLKIINDTLWVGSSMGLGKYCNNKYVPYLDDVVQDDVNSILISADKKYILLGQNNGLSFYNIKNHQIEYTISIKDGLPGNEISISGLYESKDGLIWIGTFHGVVSYNAALRKFDKSPPDLLISIQLNGKKVKELPNKLVHYQNNITFELTAISFKDEKSIEYEFFMEGLDYDYAASKGKDYKSLYQNLPAGTYNFKYRAKGKDNIWSEYSNIQFVIEKPFWNQIWFKILIGIIIIIIGWLVTIWRSHSLKQSNKKLEAMVAERTQEIVFQKNEILEKNEELLQQREEILAQTEHLENTNRDLSILNQQYEEVMQQLSIMNNEMEEQNRILIEQKSELLEKSAELSEVIEELRATSDTLHDTNKELEKLSIVASKTDNAVIIADSDFKIEWVNEAFTKMMGMGLHEFLMERGTTLFEVSSNKNIEFVIQESVKNKTSEIYISKSYRKDGSEIYAQTTITPIFDEEGKLSKLIAIDADITKIKEAEKEINSKNKKILQSIIYARRIQTAILQPEKFISRFLADYFILYKPKDIVSGDFYWFSKHKNKIIAVVADCTGHGVPGAFMSLLGISFLNEIVMRIKDKAEQSLRTDLILNELRDKVIKSLHQKKQDEAKDGMDISLCIIDFDTRIIQFSGANNSIYIIKNENHSEIIELKANKMPIGIYAGEQKAFSYQEYPFKTGDVLYMLTDGYIDQFGGKTGRKFLGTRFKNLLLQIHKQPMLEQLNFLDKNIEDWRTTNKVYPQLDDILVFGTKF